MLTKDDLAQLKKLIREEIEADGENTRDHLESQIHLSRMGVDTRLDKLDDCMKNMEIKMRKMQKDISTMVDFFDKADVGLNKRVTKLEQQIASS